MPPKREGPKMGEKLTQRDVATIIADVRGRIMRDLDNAIFIYWAAERTGDAVSMGMAVAQIERCERQLDRIKVRVAA